MSARRLHGVVARFAEPEALVAAAQRARDDGYDRLDAFSPFPVPDLDVAVEARRRPWIPLAVLGGGLTGAIGGYLMQYWMNAVDYPINVGGRPLHSWPAFIPVTFELGILLAALSGVTALLVVTGLPRPHHPLFDVPGFDRATRDRFFLLIRADDPHFDIDRTRQFLQGLTPEEVRDVPE